MTDERSIRVGEPRLSIILATDTWPTIRPVVDRLRKQTVREHLEVVLIAPQARDLEPALAHRDEFAALRIVEHSVADLADARAVGIRAAAAPIVFVGETHSYPHPGFAEALLKAMEGDWSAVAPGFGNANAKGALSWSGFLSDYGRWVHTLPAGEIGEVPLYNAAYRKSVLLEFGDGLARALSHGDELPRTMEAKGYRCFLEPAARIDHVNIARPWNWIRERIVAGHLIAGYRARRWPLSRRLLYVAGSPLIPLVLIRRVLPGIRQTARQLPLPGGTVALIALGMIVKAAGEFAGYAGANLEKAEHEMWEYEVHKLAYTGRSQT